jgi:hypothetical protein
MWGTIALREDRRKGDESRKIRGHNLRFIDPPSISIPEVAGMSSLESRY